MERYTVVDEDSKHQYLTAFIFVIDGDNKTYKGLCFEAVDGEGEDNGEPLLLIETEDDGSYGIECQDIKHIEILDKPLW